MTLWLMSHDVRLGTAKQCVTGNLGIDKWRPRIRPLQNRRYSTIVHSLWLKIIKKASQSKTCILTNIFSTKKLGFCWTLKKILKKNRETLFTFKLHREQNSLHFDEIFPKKIQNSEFWLEKENHETIRETLFTFKVHNAKLLSFWRDLFKMQYCPFLGGKFEKLPIQIEWILFFRQNTHDTFLGDFQTVCTMYPISILWCTLPLYITISHPRCCAKKVKYHLLHSPLLFITADVIVIYVEGIVTNSALSVVLPCTTASIQTQTLKATRMAKAIQGSQWKWLHWDNGENYLAF